MLKNKKVIITGGSAGIGKSIALCFVKNGADVAIFGTNEEKLNSAKTELEAHRKEPVQKILSYKVDVSFLSQVQAAIAELAQIFGQIDVLINNAGITRDNLFLKMTEEDWDRVIAVNLKSVYNTCKTVIRPMIKARSGKIINISSVVGLTGNAGQANYAASKAGMIGFSKSLAKEVASRDITVNCIAPGFIVTDMTKNLSEQLQQELMEKIPMQRLGHVEDVANAALFLASDLSDYITGQVLTVDGGMVM